jgi:hypothetical protein
MIEIKNPKNPKIAIPIAETLVIVLNSTFDGFFNTSQTLLHFVKNDFVESHNATINYIEKKSF